MFNSKKSNNENLMVEKDETSSKEESRQGAFLNTDELSKSNAAPDSQVITPSIISAGAVLQGALRSPSPVHSEGVIDGELDAPQVTLGHGSKMTGKLRCSTLTVNGSFDGDLECAEAIAGGNAIVDGTVSCLSFQVSPGASINGKLAIGSSQH